MSGDTGYPVQMSIKNGLSPGGANVVLVIGIAMILVMFINWTFFGIAIFGIIFVIAGLVGPRSFYKFTRMPDGLQYRWRWQTYFYPYADIREILFDFHPTRAVDYYNRGMYTGSRAFAVVRIVLVLPTEQLPIQVKSSVNFNKNRVAPDPKSLEVKVLELRDKWMQVLSKPANFSQ